MYITYLAVQSVNKAASSDIREKKKIATVVSQPRVLECEPESPN